MIADTVRTNTYREAILKNYRYFYGKVVVDVGAGTGILSIFCAQAGAKKVYAIEASNMADQIKLVTKENNMEEKIQVINGKVEDVDLPEKVDVIVSEWMGYCLLYESMCQSVLTARDKWLKEDGVMFPCTATLYLALLSDPDAMQDRTEFWEDVESRYKVKMKSMIPYARKCLTNHVHVNYVPQENIFSHPSKVCHFNLNKITVSEVENIKSDFTFQCFGSAEINGFVTWFDVNFPDNITLSTSPYCSETHWQQCLMFINKTVHVTQDTTIHGSIKIKPNCKFSRFLDITLHYGLQDGDLFEETYLMDDFIS